MISNSNIGGQQLNREHLAEVADNARERNLDRPPYSLFVVDTDDSVTERSR